MDAIDYDRDHVDPFVYFQGEPDHSDTNFISLTSISLLLVLLIFFSLYLYTKCVQTPQTHHRATIHQLTLTELAHNSTQSSNIGLNPALIVALPMFVFKPKKKEHGQSHDDDGGGASTMECAVCLSALEDEEMAKLLPNCRHTFHVSCIDTWLASHPTCPMCRTKVQPWLELLPREGPTPTGLALDGAPTLELGREVSRTRPNSSSAHLQTS